MINIKATFSTESPKNDPSTTQGPSVWRSSSVVPTIALRSGRRPHAVLLLSTPFKDPPPPKFATHGRRFSLWHRAFCRFEFVQKGLKIANHELVGSRLKNFHARSEERRDRKSTRLNSSH